MRRRVRGWRDGAGGHALGALGGFDGGRCERLEQRGEPGLAAVPGSTAGSLFSRARSRPERGEQFHQPPGPGSGREQYCVQGPGGHRRKVNRADQASTGRARVTEWQRAQDYSDIVYETAEGIAKAGNSGYNGPVMVLPDGRIVPATSTGVPGAVAATQSISAWRTGFRRTGSVRRFRGALAQRRGNSAECPERAEQRTGLTRAQQPPTGAAGLINQILTTPRPGGINGMPGTFVPNAPGSPGNATHCRSRCYNHRSARRTASDRCRTGRRGEQARAGRHQDLHDQHTKYNEWEFVYDISKDPTKNLQPNMAGAAGRGGERQRRPGQRGTRQHHHTGFIAVRSVAGYRPAAPVPPNRKRCHAVITSL